MKTLKIENYEQLEQLTEQQAKENSTKEVKIKDFNGYFVNTTPYYGLTLLVYKNTHLVYIDEQIQYNNKKGKNLITTMIDRATAKLYAQNELIDELQDYTDYCNKMNFLNNYYQKQCEAVSIYNEKGKQAKADGWHYADFISFCYYKDKQDYNTLKETYNNIEKQHHEKLNEENYFRNAIADELSNCEYIYGGYDSLCRALDSLGLTPKTLTEQQKSITQEEINKIEKMYY